MRHTQKYSPYIYEEIKQNNMWEGQGGKLSINIYIYMYIIYIYIESKETGSASDVLRGSLFFPNQGRPETGISTGL